MASFKLVLKSKVKNILSPVTVRSFDNFRNKGNLISYLWKRCQKWLWQALHRLLGVNVCVGCSFKYIKLSSLSKSFLSNPHPQKENSRCLKMTFACYYNVRSVVEKLFIVTGAEIARQNSLNGLPTINLFLFKYSLCKYRVLKMAY